MSQDSLIPWNPNTTIELTPTAEPREVVKYAALLTENDQKSIIKAIDAEAFEMVASFVWTKSIIALKQQLGNLGMAFVGEMLGRTDLDEDSNPVADIREDEAIDLAEQLAMISTTDAIRLKSNHMLIGHFLDPTISKSSEMTRDEAVSIVRNCIVNILAQPSENVPKHFVRLRKKLESELIKEDDDAIERLASSPYFFIRTILTVLLAQLKIAKSALLERASTNVTILLPVLWDKMREVDRWQTGEAYALLQVSSDRNVAALGLRRALLKVKGFDYVPETLRSDTFRAAARAVLNAHYGWENFYNEKGPVETLAKLGSSIPGPALADCLTAALCVRLGNSYGTARDAQPAVNRFLQLFQPTQWEYYLNKIMPTDRRILDKLYYDAKPLIEWLTVVSEYKLDSYNILSPVSKMIKSDRAKRYNVMNAARNFRDKIMD
ncbi:hypothetical protein [Hymenobacter cheonanensis]|uniref:hypothetical protein n=1 Tax=Hymenobacter sp. CA2-7 TaxID=3063993 RepID=UPI0027123A9D|nr:hypothetical protein [Hymenobacter sp. CA2-7]MDO7888138.1 hypothetical protein [Hymenobacter sp. CA2-7]